MDTSLGAFLTLYQFTTGRRLFVFRQTRKVAQALDFKPLLAHLDRAHSFDLKTRELEQEWVYQQRNKGQDFRPLDNALDRSLTALARMCEGMLHGMPLESPLYLAAQKVYTKAFPNGPGAITRLPYVDELSQVEFLLNDLTGTLQAELQTLSLSPVLDNIRARHKDFSEALAKSQKEDIDHGDVKAARETGQQHLLQMVAIILGAYHDDKDHVERRHQLLTSVARQQARITELLNRRRPITDVDPESGEELPEPPTPGEQTTPPTE